MGHMTDASDALPGREDGGRSIYGGDSGFKKTDHLLEGESLDMDITW